MGDRGIKHQLRETIVIQARPLLVCVGLVFNVTDYMLLAYMPTYLTENLAFEMTTSLLLVMVVMVLIGGHLRRYRRPSDRIGRRRIVLTGCLGLLVLSLASFLLIQQRTTGAILAGLLALGLVLDCFTGTMPATLPALFPTRVRYGALSIRFNAAVALFGGTMPLIVAGLVTATGSTLMPAAYLIAAAVGAVAAYFMRETAGRSLKGSTPTVTSQEEGAPDGGGGLASGERAEEAVWSALDRPGGTRGCAASPGRASDDQCRRRDAVACLPAGSGLRWRSARRASARESGARGGRLR